MSAQNFTILMVLTAAFLYISCTQNLYKFVPDHCEVTHINKSLINVEHGECYKLSRTELYLNLSFRLSFDVLNDDTLQVKITGYQFRSNEYRKGPIEFMLGACSAIASKDFDIPHMLQHSNLKCPMRKGVKYYAYKLSPNATNMPPLIPEGRWKLQLDFLYLNQFIVFSVEWFSGVEYFLKFI